jgi:hypothetical protein
LNLFFELVSLIGHSCFGGRKGKNIRPWANLEKTYSEQFGEHLGHPKDEVELTIWQCGLSNWAVLLEIVMNMDGCGQASF